MGTPWKPPRAKLARSGEVCLAALAHVPRKASSPAGLRVADSLLSATAATHTEAEAAAPAAAVPARPKPAPAKPAPIPSPVANFDARNPSSVMAIFNLAGGKATLVDKDTDAVLLNVTSVAANFTIFFASCDAQGRACKALQFDYPDDKPGPTFAPDNAFQSDLGPVPRL